ncbi:mitochondrial sorting homolog [Procambarus clarkii]|uniref:mitochondrial sorting homolog n=1 Tax=Procambarus clarkii TaxID=6728 RepID=UPI001E6759FC|nr:mitochondrial sorting homolog [Procambarus clarkii]
MIVKALKIICKSLAIALLVAVLVAVTVGVVVRIVFEGCIIFVFFLAYKMGTLWMENGNFDLSPFDDFADPNLQSLAQDLGVKRETVESLTRYEKKVLPWLIPRGKLGITWEDVGGCEEALDRIWQQLVLPLLYARYIGRDPLIMPAKGILLHGDPGCGKTLIAKAITAEVNANFISVDLSTLRSKWLGESEKMAGAIFNLAFKIQPCIIFIDEVDALLGTRNEIDNNTDLTIKSVFLSRWDGLETDSQSMVFILAASNRKDALDHAILRRFSLQFHIPKPNLEGRLQILGILFRGLQLDDDVDIEELAKMTQGFTGADLKEVVRSAAVAGLEELLYGDPRHLPGDLTSSQIKRLQNEEPRLISMADLTTAVALTRHRQSNIHHLYL